MMPNAPATKRSALHLNGRHHTTYHPYYSSSPMNTNIVSHTSQTNTKSTAKNVKRNEHEEENYLELDQMSNNSVNNNTPNKFNLFYNNNLSSNQSLNNSDLDADLSAVSGQTPSTNTRPPTTPVSSSNCNNSLNIGDDVSNSASPQLARTEFRINRLDESKSYPSSISSVSTCSYVQSTGDCKQQEDARFVSPANYISSLSASAVSCANKSVETDNDLKTGSSSASSVYSSALATYSRSSSMNSLNSFDIKSQHSCVDSIPSEYSSASANPFNNLKNSEDMYSTKYQGCVTPTTYGELPSSPGELFPCNQQERIQENTFYYSINNSNMPNSNLNSVNNSAIRHNNKPVSMNEISVCTVDSNPSKSNDITVIERTMLGSHSHNNTHLGGFGGGNSMGNTFIYNQEDDSNLKDMTNSINNDPTNQQLDNDEEVILYDMEGSLCTTSTRSNVSGLTFPSEPAADLAFIRNLLNKKSTPLSTDKTQNSVSDYSNIDSSKLEGLFKMIEQNNNEDLMNKSKLQDLTQVPNNNTHLEHQKKQHQWSNFTNKQFTPPVKLKSDDLEVNNRTNKKLFNDDEDYNDEARSIASLPSEIAFDRSQNVSLAKSSFNALFQKLDRSSCEQSPCNVEKPKPPVFSQLNRVGLLLNNNSPANFKDKIREDAYLKNFAIQKESDVSYQEVNANEDSLSAEEYNSYYELQENQEEESGDSDEEFLNEFINEMLPKAFDEEEAGSEREDEEERDESAYNDQEEETTEDYEQQQQIQKYLAERNFYRSETEHVMTRILPKIDEVDNENDESRCEEEEKPKSKAHRNLIGKTLNHPAPKPTTVNVHMTKTSRLRENKIKSTTKSNQPKSTSSLGNINKRPPTSTISKNTENAEKIKSSGSACKYNMPTKSSKMKTQTSNNSNSELTTSDKKTKTSALTPSNKLNTIKSSKSFNF